MLLPKYYDSMTLFVYIHNNAILLLLYNILCRRRQSFSQLLNYSFTNCSTCKIFQEKMTNKSAAHSNMLISIIMFGFSFEQFYCTFSYINHCYTNFPAWRRISQIWTIHSSYVILMSWCPQGAPAPLVVDEVFYKLSDAHKLSEYCTEGVSANITLWLVTLRWILTASLLHHWSQMLKISWHYITMTGAKWIQNKLVGPCANKWWALSTCNF